MLIWACNVPLDFLSPIPTWPDPDLPVRLACLTTAQKGRGRWAGKPEGGQLCQDGAWAHGAGPRQGWGHRACWGARGKSPLCRGAGDRCAVRVAPASPFRLWNNIFKNTNRP